MVPTIWYGANDKTVSRKSHCKSRLREVCMLCKGLINSMVTETD
jgi:hypothetical protein